MKKSDRDLGMDREINRRDFLNGASIAIAGAVLAPGASEAQGREASPAPAAARRAAPGAAARAPRGSARAASRHPPRPAPRRCGAPSARLHVLLLAAPRGSQSTARCSDRQRDQRSPGAVSYTHPTLPTTHAA